MQRLLCGKFCSFTWLLIADGREVLGWSDVFLVKDGGLRNLNIDCHDLAVYQWSLWLLKAGQEGWSWESVLQAPRSCCHSVSMSEEKLWTAFSGKCPDEADAWHSYPWKSMVCSGTTKMSTKPLLLQLKGLPSAAFQKLLWFWFSFSSQVVAPDGRWWCFFPKYMEIIRWKKIELQDGIIVMMFATAQLPCFQYLSNSALNLGDKIIVFL